MKTIAIVGTGIAALRAGLELFQQPNYRLTFWEKAPSVGGRVATRRFDSGFVNHGAPQFDGSERVLAADPLAAEYAALMGFDGQATALPKAMRDALLVDPARVEFRFKAPVAQVSSNGDLIDSNGMKHLYDHVLVTAPMPQSRTILGSVVLPEVFYAKKILFVSANERIEMTESWSNEHFEEVDEIIRALAERKLDQDLASYDVKKWRYSEVIRGEKQPFYPHSARVTVAGDAFDPTGEYGLAAAWLSGLAAARHITT